MYKHILIPTDGSRRSETAAHAAIQLAKILGARVTALHVVPQAEYPALEAWVHNDTKFADHIDGAFRRHAAMFLENVRDAALRAGVRCDCRIAKAPLPHEAIVAAAHENKCDLIFMAPHDLERGSSESETLKVAGLGDIPVLVHH